jgi:hypothetical protein
MIVQIGSAERICQKESLQTILAKSPCKNCESWRSQTTPTIDGDSVQPLGNLATELADTA